MSNMEDDDVSIETDEAFGAALSSQIAASTMGEDLVEEFPPGEDRAEVVEQKEQEQEEKILGKFKSQEDLAHAYEEIEREKGRLAQEVGQWREWGQQVTQQNQTQQPAGVQINEGTVDWFDEQIEQNPAGAATWALQNDPSGVLYQRAVDYWWETNPRQAAAYERELDRQATLMQAQQMVEQRTAPLSQHASVSEFANVFARTRQRHPDLAEMVDGIQQAGVDNPELAAMIQHGDQGQKERALENLYAIAKFRQAQQASAVSGAAQQVVQNQEVQKAAAVRAAHVASPSVSSTRTANGRLEEWMKRTFLEPESSSLAEGFKFGD